MVIFVANLPVWMHSKALSALFLPYGKISESRVIYDRETNRAKRYGFVRMDDDAEAEKAIEALCGTIVDGRELFVAPAKGVGHGKNASAAADDPPLPC